MFKAGQLLGFFSINLGADGQTVTRGSTALLIWSNFVSLFQSVGYTSYSLYYMVFHKIDEKYSTMINFILALMQNSLFGVFIVLWSYIMIFRREEILKIVIFAKTLKNLFSSLKIEKDGNVQKHLFYINCVNIAIGLFFPTAIAIIMILNFIWDPTLIEFMAIIFETTSWATYSYVISMYCILFSYGFFLLRKLCDNLSSRDCHLLPIYHHLLLKFLKKVNVFMQTMVVLVVFDGFVGIVADVSSDMT